MYFLIFILGFGETTTPANQGDLKPNLNQLNDSELTKVVMRLGERAGLHQLTKMSDSFAEFLAKSPLHLNLDGLSQISENQAKSLGQHSGILSLNGLKNLSLPQARYLGKHNRRLYLNGLEHLDFEIAKEIKLKMGAIYLGGIKKLEGPTLNVLISNMHYNKSDSRIGYNRKIVGNYFDIEDIKMFESLEFICENKMISLNGISEITNEIAQELNGAKIPIELNGVEKIDKMAFKKFDSKEVAISFGGVKEVTNDIIELIDEAKGDYWFRNAKIKTKENALEITKREWQWRFPKFECFPAEAAELFVKLEGPIRLNDLKNIENKSLDILCGSGRTLYLGGLSALSDEQANIISKYVCNVHLDGVKYLSLPACVALGKHLGKISLNGLETLTVQQAEGLSKHIGGLSLDELNHISDPIADLLKDTVGDLSLNGLKKISQNAARSLGQHNGSLYLKGIEIIDNISLGELAKIRPIFDSERKLINNNIHVSKRQLEFVMNNDGIFNSNLSLGGLREITNNQSEKLIGLKMNLYLDSVKEINDCQATNLAKIKEPVFLPSVTHLPVSQILIYRSNKANIFLDGLITLTDRQCDEIAKTEKFISFPNVAFITKKSLEKLKKRGLIDISISKSNFDTLPCDPFQ